MAHLTRKKMALGIASLYEDTDTSDGTLGSPTQNTSSTREILETAMDVNITDLVLDSNGSSRPHKVQSSEQDPHKTRPNPPSSDSDMASSSLSSDEYVHHVTPPIFSTQCLSSPADLDEESPQETSKYDRTQARIRKEWIGTSQFLTEQSMELQQQVRSFSLQLVTLQSTTFDTTCAGSS